ncbi:MAG: OmpA family protein [Sphingomonadaceae bacterium]
MKKSRAIISGFAALSLLSVTACVTDPNTGDKKVSRTAIGGLGGAGVGSILGGLIGGKTGRIIGAVGGGAIGGVVGYNMDKQIRELKDATEGSGVDVSPTDDGSAILVNLPDGVTFATNSYTINPAFQTTLNDVASSLMQYPNSLVDVRGFTDSTGSEAYNQTLSERRAEAVKNYLVSRGVASARIRSQGFGEMNPVADNSTEAGRAMNRRVEIMIVPVTNEEIENAKSSG